MKKNAITNIMLGVLCVAALGGLSSVIIKNINKPGNEPSISFPIVDDSASTSSDEQKEYELKIEAEDCVLGGEAQVKEYLSSLKAASGGKFVGGFSNNNTSSISFTISSNEATFPKIIICYGNRYDETDRTFDFNSGFELNEGENVITLRSNGPLSSNIDYFKIISTSEVIFNKAI